MNSDFRVGSTARCTRRRNLQCTAAAAGAALLGACGPLRSTTGERGATTASGCRVRIEFWSVFATTNNVVGEGTEQVINEFTRKRAGCTVDTLVVPSGEIRQKLITTQAGGAPPAIATLPPSWVTEWSVQGIAAAVDDLFRRDKLSGADFPVPLWKQMSYGGKVWFLPHHANADFVLHWNKAHFREAGLNPEKGPETIAELDTLIPKLTRERGGELERVGMQTWDLYGLGNTTQAWGYAFGGSFYDEAKDELTFNHPRILRSVEWYTGWAPRLGMERVNRVRQQVNVPGVHFFGSGRFSVHVLTLSGLNSVRRHDPTIEIGAGLFPGEPPGRTGTVAIGGWATCAIGGSPQREAAWDLMKYIGADEEGTTIIARTGVGTPGWLRSPGLAELSKDPLIKAYVDGVRRAQFPQLGFYSPAGYKLSLIQEIIDGKRGVRDVLDEINRDANVRYQEWKRQTQKR